MSIFTRKAGCAIWRVPHPLIVKALLAEAFIEHAGNHDAAAGNQVASLTDMEAVGMRS